MARSSSSLMRDRRGRFVSPAKAKAARRRAKSRSKSRSRSSSVSRKWRRSHPRDKFGRFVSPTKVRAARRRRKSKSASRSRSSSRLSAKEEKTLARRLGISVKQLREWTYAKSRRSLSDSIAKRDRRSRKAYARSKARTREPEFKRVLDHFMDVLPEQVWCPRRMCGSVYEKHRELGILPKSVADLELIFSIPSEQKGVNARCWICLYRAYRDLYKNLNGVYPAHAPDVSDDFAGSKLGYVSEESSVSYGRELSPAVKMSEVAYLKEQRAKLKNYCSAMLSVDPRTGESEFDIDAEIEGAKEVIRDLGKKYPDIKDGLSSATSISALRGNCELLSSRLGRYIREVDPSREYNDTSAPEIMSSSFSAADFIGEFPPASPPSSSFPSAPSEDLSSDESAGEIPENLEGRGREFSF